MLKRNHLLAAAVIFLLAFFAFSFWVYQGGLRTIDFNTTVRIQDHVSARFDFPFSLLSLVASIEVASLILLGVLFFVTKTNKIIVILLYGLIAFAGLFGKTFINHPPPPFMFFKYDISFYFPSTYVQPGSSYPSGHAGRTAFISVLLLVWVINHKKLSPPAKILISILILGFDAAVFISRVYLGEHWTTDVIGGALLGAGLGLLTWAIPADIIPSFRKVISKA